MHSSNILIELLITIAYSKNSKQEIKVTLPSTYCSSRLNNKESKEESKIELIIEQICAESNCQSNKRLLLVLENNSK